MLAAVDIETTGDRVGWHEICQIAVVPAAAAPFIERLRVRRERADPAASRVHGLDLAVRAPSAERVAELLIEWAAGRRFDPLACNWPFEGRFLTDWLGSKQLGQLFTWHPRDPMQLAIGLNDAARRGGRAAPFKSVGLSGLCRFFGVDNPKPHDAYYDALAAAAVYEHLCRFALSPA